MCSQQHKHIKQWEEEEKTRKKSVAWETRRGPGGECGWVWREWIGSDVVRSMNRTFSFVWGTRKARQASQHHIFHPQQHHLIRLYTFFPFFHCCCFSLIAGCDVIVFFLQGSEQQTSGIKDGVSCDVRQIRNSSMTRMENTKREENRREKSMRNREVRWSSATMSRVGKAAYSRNLC